MQIPWPNQEIFTFIYESEVDSRTQDRVVGQGKIKLFILSHAQKQDSCKVNFVFKSDLRNFKNFMSVCFVLFFV